MWTLGKVLVSFLSEKHHWTGGGGELEQEMPFLNTNNPPSPPQKNSLPHIYPYFTFFWGGSEGGNCRKLVASRPQSKIPVLATHHLLPKTVANRRDAKQNWSLHNRLACSSMGYVHAYNSCSATTSHKHSMGQTYRRQPWGTFTNNKEVKVIGGIY